MTSNLKQTQLPKTAPKSPLPLVLPPSTPQTASIPLALYREVSSDLQATQAQLESIKQDNQRLVQQNQHLRVEIERVVQSSLRLRQLADAVQPTSDAMSAIGLESESHLDALMPAMPRSPEPAQPPLPRPSLGAIVAEQEASPQRQPLAPEKSSEVSAWWLALVICVIIVTAFGTGFLIVRPLLPSR